MAELKLSHKQTADFELLANGGFAPLEGFQGSEAWGSVVDSMRLPDGQPWPIPVTLASEVGEVGDTIELTGHEGSKLGTITVEEVYERDLAREAENVFRTTDEEHPGVAMTYREGARTIAGPISVEKLPEHIDAVKPYLLSPADTKKTFEERGWKTVVAFQTRNPIHRAHEYITKSALEIVDGLFIHPIVGETKSDDIPPETRMRCYEVLIENYYVPERVLLGVVQDVAGVREEEPVLDPRRGVREASREETGETAPSIGEVRRGEAGNEVRAGGFRIGVSENLIGFVPMRGA